LRGVDVWFVGGDTGVLGADRASLRDCGLAGAFDKAAAVAFVTDVGPGESASPEDVAAHELAHAMLCASGYGAHTPDWLSEGLVAVSLETDGAASEPALLRIGPALPPFAEFVRVRSPQEFSDRYVERVVAKLPKAFRDSLLPSARAGLRGVYAVYGEALCRFVTQTTPERSSAFLDFCTAMRRAASDEESGRLCADFIDRIEHAGASTGALDEEFWRWVGQRGSGRSDLSLSPRTQPPAAVRELGERSR
jgi:hypothetical protein